MREKRPENEVSLIIYGFKKLGEEHFAEEFFQMLQDANKAYIPDKIGMSEPIKTPFSLEQAKIMWVESERFYSSFGNIMLKGKKFRGDIIWQNDNSNIIGLHISRELAIKNNGTERLTDLAKKLFLWANGAWGYVNHSSNSMYTPGLSFRTCIGGIPWMALFGPPYVEMFGREVIETAPCKVEEFAENCFMLLTSDEPMPLTCELQETQARVKKHLGEDAFCRYDHPTRLTIEDMKAGKGRTSTEGYRSPDLSAYIKDTMKKEDAELIVDAVEDEMITKSQRTGIRKEFMAFVRKNNPEVEVVTEKNDSIVLKVEGKEIECFFDNLYKVCENTDSLEEREQIYEHFLRTLPKNKEEISLKTHGASIMPRLAPVSILDELAKLGAIPHRPFADTGLIITYVIDFPEKVMYLTNKHLAQLDIDEDSLHSLAMTNIEKTFPVEAVINVLDQKAAYTVKIMDSHDAARVLLIPKYLLKGTEVVALIPDRNTLVIASVPADGNWSKLKKLAQAASGRPLFTNPLLVSKNGFTTIQ